MPAVKFNGTWTALTTPFKEDNSVDYKGLKKNIEFQITNGITGVLAVGTTGESPTLNEDEHSMVIKKTKEFSGDSCDVLAGTGSNNTENALNYCRDALKSGIDKVLLVDCYYNGPSSLELRDEYYKTILDNLKDVKVVFYVIPGRTGTQISEVDIAVLSAKYDRVIAIKEATGDFDRMEKERALMPEMSIMSGDDSNTMFMITNPRIKANGVISVISNIAPKAVSEMVNNALSGNIIKAEKLSQKLEALFSIVTVKAKSKRILSDGREYIVEDKFRNPLAIKTAMKALGMPSGLPRKPLGKMTPEGIKIVRETLKKTYENSSDILTPIEDFYNINIKERLSNDNIWEELTYSFK